MVLVRLQKLPIWRTASSMMNVLYTPSTNRMFTENAVLIDHTLVVAVFRSTGPLVVLVGVRLTCILVSVSGGLGSVDEGLE